LAAAALASAIGCGNTYRPVVSAINPVGPAAQPQKFAVAISTTGTTANPTPGLVTFVDFSGDTVLITAQIGVNPYYLILNSGGSTGYTLNSDHTLSTFDISTSLLQSQILQTTLLPGANPVSIFPEGANTYVTDPGLNAISQFVGQPLNLQQELAINPAFTPIYVVGIASAPRVYAISQRVGGGPGQVSTIETTSNTIDPNPIPVGSGPVYGVMTADAKRAFIMNQTDGTVSVINAQTNLPDILPGGAKNPITVGQSPLWADFAPARNEMVVANAGDGVHAGSVSIISIPLCSATAQPGNPNCDLNNPDRRHQPPHDWRSAGYNQHPRLCRQWRQPQPALRRPHPGASARQLHRLGHQPHHQHRHGDDPPSRQSHRRCLSQHQRTSQLHRRHQWHANRQSLRHLS
jgi:hypothetical protein